MAEHGPPPPRRPSNRPDSGDGEYERHWQDRLRRPERTEGTNWRQLEEAFGPESDSEAPPWAGPDLNPYPRRAASSPRRAGRARLADPYDAGPAEAFPPQPPPESAGTGYRGRRRGADADAVQAEAGTAAYPAQADPFLAEQEAQLRERDAYLREQDAHLRQRDPEQAGYPALYDDEAGGYDPGPAGPYADERAATHRRAPEPYQPANPYSAADLAGADRVTWPDEDEDTGFSAAAEAGRAGRYRREPAGDRGPSGGTRTADRDGTDGDGREPGGFAPRQFARRGRAAATRLRRSRRRVIRLCAVAIVACVVIAAIVAIVTHHTPAKVSYVTSLQKGEYKSAPDACSSVSSDTLSSYLPGTIAKSDEQSGSAESQCSFTIDSKPNLLVLEVTSAQYQPLAAASGNGSATRNAQDSFGQAEQNLTHPAKRSPLSAARISSLAGLGQQAIVGVQTEHAGRISTDLVTVLVRQRNVLITITMSGQESGHGFGPVPVATLQSGATAAAKDVLAKLAKIPTA